MSTPEISEMFQKKVNINYNHAVNQVCYLLLLNDKLQARVQELLRGLGGQKVCDFLLGFSI